MPSNNPAQPRTNSADATRTDAAGPDATGPVANHPETPAGQHGKVLGTGRTSRREVVDRRTGSDRRDERPADARPEPVTTGDAQHGPTEPEQDRALTLSGLERRRGPGRRLSDFQRSAEEGDLTSEQFLFVAAIDAFKRSNNKTFPTWTDVLEVVRLLGYRKTMASELRITNAEDWREPADAPANVRPQGWERRFAA